MSKPESSADQHESQKARWQRELKALADSARRADKAAIAARNKRDEQIRELLKSGHSASAIADVLGFDRARVYQIRDHRR